MFFQSHLIKGNELAFRETASNVTSRWRGTLMACVTKFETPRTNGSRTQRLCSKGVMTETLSILSSVFHSDGAQSNIVLVILSAEEVIKFHCGVSHIPNVYGQDWKFYPHVFLTPHSWLNFLILMSSLHLCSCSLTGIAVIDDIQLDEIF